MTTDKIKWINGVLTALEEMDLDAADEEALNFYNTIWSEYEDLSEETKKKIHELSWEGGEEK